MRRARGVAKSAFVVVVFASEKNRASEKNPSSTLELLHRLALALHVHRLPGGVELGARLRALLLHGALLGRLSLLLRAPRRRLLLRDRVSLPLLVGERGGFLRLRRGARRNGLAQPRAGLLGQRPYSPPCGSSAS